MLWIGTVLIIRPVRFVAMAVFLITQFRLGDATICNVQLDLVQCFCLAMNGRCCPIG